MTRTTQSIISAKSTTTLAFGVEVMRLEVKVKLCNSVCDSRLGLLKKQNDLVKSAA